MHRFSTFIRSHLVLLALGLSACGGGSNDACPDGFVPTDGVCMPAPDASAGDAGTPDGDTTDAAPDGGGDGGGGADGGPGTTTYYADTDMDGFGDPDSSMEAEEAPAGFVTDATDCDDTNADVHPDATEVCNDVDDNCDGSVDEGVATAYYADTDMDGFGDPSSTMDACAAPTGFVEDSTDCDDTAEGVNPDAAEVCNGVDDNCDGTVDEGVATTYYADTDMDGFGDASSTMDACAAPTGFVEDSTDCDDTAMGVHPGATEVCDGVDDDCNGSVDDGLSVPSCALTAGVCAGAVQVCGGASGWVACRGAASYGASYEDGAETSCDHLDNDCDGSTDEGTRTQFYADCDGDGARDAAVRRGACDAAEALAYFESHGHPGCMAALPASAPEDCDDSRASVRPGATEVCNGRDDNCNGGVDDGLVFRDYYRDADSDGFGDPGVVTNACSRPSGFVTDSTDCADGDANAHPGQTAYFTTPITGTRVLGTPAYDYDCDLVASPLYTQNANCPTRGGWESLIPTCGVSRRFVLWAPLTRECGSVFDRTQPCR